jgi:alkaline phosphatase D
VNKAVAGGSLNSLDMMLTSNNILLTYADTDAQGYSVITPTPGVLPCAFRKVTPASPMRRGVFPGR